MAYCQSAEVSTQDFLWLRTTFFKKKDSKACLYFFLQYLFFRYGSAAILTLDGGEGRRYNDSFLFTGHQMMTVDKQEGVYAGGKAEYTGVRTFEVYSDFSKGCMDDIRLEGKHLPLPPALNGTQWGQATMARNLQRNCPSNNPCANVICPKYVLKYI